MLHGGKTLAVVSGTSGAPVANPVADRVGSAGPKYPYGASLGSPAGDDAVDFARYTRDAASRLEYANQRYHSPRY